MDLPVKYIYVVSHPETKDVVYVGCSKNVESRARGHALTMSSPLYRFINGLVKSGLFPVFTIVERYEGHDPLPVENKWILEYYNKGCSLLNRRIPGVKKKGKCYFTLVDNTI